MAEIFQSEFEARFAELRGTVGCPACRGELRLEAATLICEQCGRVYPVVDGIPVLIADQKLSG
jgi:uncharacterized protein YbaR (Trm112 family)